MIILFSKEKKIFESNNLSLSIVVYFNNSDSKITLPTKLNTTSTFSNAFIEIDKKLFFAESIVINLNIDKPSIINLTSLKEYSKKEDFEELSKIDKNKLKNMQQEIKILNTKMKFGDSNIEDIKKLFQLEKTFSLYNFYIKWGANWLSRK